MEYEGSENTTMPPRNWLQEALLILGSAGLYFTVWFFLAARDIQRVSGEKLTPFWWLWIPLVAFAQPFTFPHFFARLRSAEKAAGLKSWPRFFDYFWIVVFFIGSVFFLMTDFIDTPLKLNIGVFGLFILCHWPLHQRLNRLRKSWQSAPLLPRKAGYNAIEWMVVGFFLPTLLILYGLFAP